MVIPIAILHSAAHRGARYELPGPLRVGARLGSARAGLTGWLVWLPRGGAVGDQRGDGQSGFLEVLAASDPALQGPPLLGFGYGVLDADPLGGLLVPELFPAGGLLGRRILARLLGRAADLGREVTGQALIPGVDLGFDIGMAAEQVFDPVGAQRGDVMHPARPERAQPQQPPVPVADSR